MTDSPLAPRDMFGGWRLDEAVGLPIEHQFVLRSSWRIEAIPVRQLLSAIALRWLLNVSLWLPNFFSLKSCNNIIVTYV